jgi:hypothetical protein
MAPATGAILVAFTASVPDENETLGATADANCVAAGVRMLASGAETPGSALTSK